MSGKQLEETRRKLGLARWEFGALLGYSEQTVWRWETGRAVISERNAVVIRGKLADHAQPKAGK